ncbi:MAG: T9SS type A sorting domain-containing protein, partial [Ignavibacteriaceae bacterium]|nr:T9SS type A sorting domain-containing protein [Ignavibacteriaceae bacterium]
LFTSDRGETWNEVETPDSSIVYDLQFLDARHGYAVGESGVILKLDPSLVDVEPETSTPTEFILYQNYPNPFNPTSKIKFRISDRGFVNLKVFDILGNEVATLVNEEKTAGEYEVEFNAKGLSNGIYFYKMQAGNFAETKKLVLMK